MVVGKLISFLLSAPVADGAESRVLGRLGASRLSRLHAKSLHTETQAIPWYHYIPVRYDFLDLFDIVGYFSGDHDNPGSPAQVTITTTAETEPASLPEGIMDDVASRAPAQRARRAEAEAAGRSEEDGSAVRLRERAEELGRRDKIAEDIGTRGREFAVSRMGCVVPVLGSSQNCVLSGSSACCGQGVI